MKVQQLKYSADNFSYLIYGEKDAIAVDCGAVDNLLSFLNNNKLTLKAIVNTHDHYDHTPGNKRLLKETCAVYLDNKKLMDDSSINLEGENIKVYHTPGHTEDSLCFYVSNSILITGDTLFNGTIGNCFSGDIGSFFNSIKFLMTHPNDTIIYSGHDYIDMAMAFAENLEPDNKYIEKFLKNYNPDNVYSTMEQEKKINPYLRFNDEKMINILHNKGFTINTEYDRWKALMKL